MTVSVYNSDDGWKRQEEKIFAQHKLKRSQPQQHLRYCQLAVTSFYVASKLYYKLENVAIANALQVEAARATPVLSRLRRHVKFEVGGCVAQLAERRSFAGELTLSYARPAADGWPLYG